MRMCSSTDPRCTGQRGPVDGSWVASVWYLLMTRVSNRPHQGRFPPRLEDAAGFQLVDQGTGRNCAGADCGMSLIFFSVCHLATLRLPRKCQQLACPTSQGTQTRRPVTAADISAQLYCSIRLRPGSSSPCISKRLVPRRSPHPNGQLSLLNSQLPLMSPPGVGSPMALNVPAWLLIIRGSRGCISPLQKLWRVL